MNNEQKIKEYKTKKIEKWIIVALYIGVIITEILALFNVIDIYWGVILFIIVYLLKKII